MPFRSPPPPPREYPEAKCPGVFLFGFLLFPLDQVFFVNGTIKQGTAQTMPPGLFKNDLWEKKPCPRTQSKDSLEKKTRISPTRPIPESRGLENIFSIHWNKGMAPWTPHHNHLLQGPPMEPLWPFFFNKSGHTLVRNLRSPPLARAVPFNWLYRSGPPRAPGKGGKERARPHRRPPCLPPKSPPPGPET